MSGTGRPGKGGEIPSGFCQKGPGFIERESGLPFVDEGEGLIITGFAVILEIGQEPSKPDADLARLDQEQAEQGDEAAVGLRALALGQQQGLGGMERCKVGPGHGIVEVAGGQEPFSDRQFPGRFFEVTLDQG